MEIEGMIIQDLGGVEGVSKAGNPWKKHEWVLETIGQFPRKVKFHVFGEKANTLVFEPGKSYAIQFDLESREFNGRWYTDVSAFAARPLETQAPVAPQYAPGTYGSVQPAAQQPQAPANPYANPYGQPAPATNPFPQSPAPDFSAGDSGEDLPF